MFEGQFDYNESTQSETRSDNEASNSILILIFDFDNERKEEKRNKITEVRKSIGSMVALQVF